MCNERLFFTDLARDRPGDDNCRCDRPFFPINAFSGAFRDYTSCQKFSSFYLFYALFDNSKLCLSTVENEGSEAITYQSPSFCLVHPVKC